MPILPPVKAKPKRPYLIHTGEKWAYGVITTCSRTDDLLPRTLKSLSAAGFGEPIIFVDGASCIEDLTNQALAGKYTIRFRGDSLGAFGNWALAAWELLVRNPLAEYYALFEDDVITYPNLKEYLESCKFPKQGYWNLFSTPENEQLAPKYYGWYESNQRGRGALALMFSRDGLMKLLSSEKFAMHPAETKNPTKNVDGVIVDSLSNLGFKEYVHFPSLVQHIGSEHSTVGNTWSLMQSSQHFKGEGYDARQMIKEPELMSYTTDEVVKKLATPGSIEPLPAPKYICEKKPVKGLVFSVESMANHMTDEGWQIQAAFTYGDYRSCGYGAEINDTDVLRILTSFNPEVVVVQDKREWDVKDNCFRCKKARFIGIEHLKQRDDIFKLTILKDSHQQPQYHRNSADEMGVHAWIIYYHPKIVKHLAPYVREEHLIRTYHTIDPQLVPEFDSHTRAGALISGAVSDAYPWRMSLVQGIRYLPETTYLKHPGYHMNGCATPEFLQLLSRFKVSICTASKYGYALRKIIESTAAGCVVVTDLPEDERLPKIDDNLIRVPPNMHPRTLGMMLNHLYSSYDPEKQKDFAERAKGFYDYRSMGIRLVSQIEELRSNYNQG